jgi:catechol 2,3-dioxygenase-like lactoylglutathione lyase family enzyme
MILAFAHPGLVVPELDRAREFYERMFGFQVIGQEGWQDNPTVDRGIGSSGSASRGYTMAGHNCFLELFEFSAPEQEGPDPGALGPHEQGVRHLAFYVDDCRAEYQRLLDLGGTTLGEPVGSDEAGYVVYCRDPFGNIIELCEIPVPEENPTRLPGVDRLGEFKGTSS